MDLRAAAKGLMSLAVRQPGDYTKHDAEGRCADAREQAHAALMDEMVTALTVDSRRVVGTPAWGRTKHAEAHEVVNDLFSGSRGEAHLIELLAIAAQAASGQCDANALRLRSQAWILTLSREHADWHADDAAEGMLS